MHTRPKYIALMVYNYFRKIKPQNITVEIADSYIFNIIKFIQILIIVDMYHFGVLTILYIKLIADQKKYQ